MKLKLLLALTILLSSINVFNSARAIDVKTAPEITPQGQQHQERSYLSQKDNQKTQEKETISTLVHNLSAPISAVVTLAGVFLALNEYKRGEKWKRREYLDKKFQEFESKPETINVRKMLINQVQIVELFPAAPDPKNQHALINSGILIKALKKQIPKDEYDHLNKAIAETENNGTPCKLQDYQRNTKSCNQKMEQVSHNYHQTVIPD